MTILWVRLPHMGAMPKDHGEYILLFGEPLVSFSWTIFGACFAMPSIRRHVDPYGHEDVPYNTHSNDNSHPILPYETQQTLARLVKEEMSKQQQCDRTTLLVTGEQEVFDDRDSGVGMFGTKISEWDSECSR